MLANPVWAQAQPTDPLAGLPADIVEDPGDADDIVNSVGPSMSRTARWPPTPP